MRSKMMCPMFLLALAGASGAMAANPIKAPRANSPDLVPRNPSHTLQFNTNSGAIMPMVSDAQVGDANSFGSKVIYVGLLGSGQVTLAEDCTGITLGPDDHCVTLNPQPAVTSFSFHDLGRITLPAKSTHDLLCFATTTFRGWGYFNETGSVNQAQFHYNISVTIENELLNDPSLIDPTTGVPFNGKLEVFIGESLADVKTLQPGAMERQQAFASRTCQAGALSKDSLSQNYALPDSIVNSFFKKPITLRINVQGSTGLVNGASIFPGIRFYGD